MPNKILISVDKKQMNIFSRNTIKLICSIDKPKSISNPNSFFRDCKKDPIEYNTKKKEKIYIIPPATPIPKSALGLMSPSPNVGWKAKIANVKNTITVNILLKK